MPREFTVNAVWVVVTASNRTYKRVFKRKHLAEKWVAEQDSPSRYKIIREDVSFSDEEAIKRNGRW